MGTVTIKQLFLGMRPYILVQLDEVGDIDIEAGGGNESEMRALANALPAIKRGIRAEQRKRKKEEALARRKGAA